MQKVAIHLEMKKNQFKYICLQTLILKARTKRWTNLNMQMRREG